jgi:hypothetical protein
VRPSGFPRRRCAAARVDAADSSLHPDNFRMGHEAIEDGRRSGDVPRKLSPVLRWTIRGNHDRPRFVSSHEDFEQVFSGRRPQGASRDSQQGLLQPGFDQKAAEHEKYSIEIPVPFLQNSKDLQSALADGKAGLIGGVSVGVKDSPWGKAFFAFFSVGSTFKLPSLPH